MHGGAGFVGHGGVRHGRVGGDVGGAWHGRVGGKVVVKNDDEMKVMIRRDDKKKKKHYSSNYVYVYFLLFTGWVKKD